MANPQREKGYTAIANELFEAMCHIRIPGEVRQIVDVVYRKTYGFNKKEDRIALSQFEDMTGLGHAAVCRSLNRAVAMNLIIKKTTRGTTIYSINKDHDSWLAVPKKRLGQSQIGDVSKKIISQSQIGDTQKTILQKTINTSATRTDKKFNPLGSEIIKAFEAVDPKNKTYYANKTQRGACDFLIEQYGLEDVLKRIQVLPKTNNIPFFPTINSPNDLKEKWVKLQEAVNRKRVEVQSKQAIVV